MPFVPFEKITYRTNFPKDIILEKLNSITEQKNFYKWLGNNYKKPFIGEICENNFRIIMNALYYKYYSSFSPIVFGEISEFGNGDIIINVFMRLHIIHRGIMIFWLAGCILFCIAPFISPSDSIEKFIVVSIGIVFFIFAYSLMTGMFKFSSSKIKKTLEEQLELIRCE